MTVKKKEEKKRKEEKKNLLNTNPGAQICMRTRHMCVRMRMVVENERKKKKSQILAGWMRMRGGGCVVHAREGNKEKKVSNAYTII